MRTVIGVMGPGERATPQDCESAFTLGQQIAQEGWVLLSGGRNVGVMDAVNQGARDAGGLTVGVLPGTNKTDASNAVDIAIVTGLASARNNINILSSDVVIACGNVEAGTLSEIALAVKAGKPVILLNNDSEAQSFLTRVGHDLVQCASSIDEAIQLTKKLL